MMRRSCFLSCSLSLLNVISSVTATEEKSKTLSAVVQFPSVPPLSLPFAPPPKWTAELSRRFAKHFPELRRRHYILYMRSFIHPSFTTPEAINSTMNATVLLGESLLLLIGSELIVNTFKELKRDELLSLVAFILSDASLSYVLRHCWEMEDMVLTDASLQLFQGKSLRSTSGLLQWLSANGKQQVPDPYCAAAVKSTIGAVYLDEGLEAARNFIHKNVLQVLE
ncbi:ribonuclease III [Trypanosoma theileri]|uniref:Ribonuclease III n=1 Tax=Trypanosoma theileri TaxID=67003 RepID=A0A1X0P475_9TRYP|nr:ribonuclease III [Trypanosoma theileri]ORC91722.1 ribonuclease III [Trypanosoma theileri]